MITLSVITFSGLHCNCYRLFMLDWVMLVKDRKRISVVRLDLFITICFCVSLFQYLSICFHNKWFADCVYSSSTNIPSKATVQKIWWQSNGTYVGRKTLAEKHPFSSRKAITVFL
jgi:hypothetical protein